MEVWALNTNLALFFDYDVILWVHRAISIVVSLFFDFSKTTCLKRMELASNDVQYIISYVRLNKSIKPYLLLKKSYLKI